MKVELHTFICDICKRERSTEHGGLPHGWARYQLIHHDGRKWEWMDVCETCNPENFHPSYKKPLLMLKKILGIKNETN